jgi:hypothetical protein
MRVRRTAFLLALMLAPVSRGHAQAAAQGSRIAPGTRVRFRLRTGVRYEARLIDLGPDVLKSGAPENGLTTTIPIRELAKLEYFEGTHRPVFRGALIGGLAGAALGATLAALDWDVGQSHTFGNHGNAVFIGARSVAIPGLVFGVLQGVLPHERWRTVALDGGSTRFDFRPLPAGGHGVGLALAF